MMQDAGRPCHVYCNGWRPRLQDLRHETLLTDLLLLYPEADIIRGYRKVDRTLNPDAEMTFRRGESQRHCFVEFFTEDSENYGQIKKQFRAYRNVAADGNFLLVVTLTETRLQGLIRNAAQVAHLALFATLTDAMRDPHGCWVDISGRTAVIQEEAEW